MTALRQVFSRPSDEALEALLAAADEVAEEINEGDTTTEEEEAA